MHNRLVRLILKIALPSALEMRGRPRLHLFEFFLGGTNLDSGVNAICSKWACAFDVPFIEDGFLHFGDTTDEVIKTFSV